VLGHAEAKDAKHSPAGPERFAYLPLPSLESRGPGKERVGSIRRVILTSFADGCESEIEWARRTLPAQDLIDEKTGEVVALLSILPSNDKMAMRYTSSAATWSTVTPVVLPGYDDPNHLRRKARNGGITAEQKRKLLNQLNTRIDGLLRKAVVQAGLSAALAEFAVIDWRKVGFLPGLDVADRYGVPGHLKSSARYHVRIQFRDQQGRAVCVPGPLCIGSGRFYGLGLFVGDEEFS
jgi:CRISPR-associated protein Csb2